MKIEGKKVVDARKPLLLKVTDKDIQNSTKKDAGGCAVAVACARQLDVKNVRVHLSSIYVEQDDKWIRYHTPQRLRNEIISFDRAHVFAADEYVIPAKNPAHRIGAEKRQRPTNPNKKTVPRPYHHITGVRASQYSNVWKKKMENKHE